LQLPNRPGAERRRVFAFLAGLLSSETSKMSNSKAGRIPPKGPLTTYRLQLNLNFTFGSAAEVVPYLHELGITDLYASPYLQARPGSLHGYDISNHNHLNPELGGEADHQALVRAIREREMGHLLDIVPNHMGIGEPGNSWWMDVLENGPSSPFAPYFDIDWHPLKPELTGKVLLPVLGDQFGKILENGELRLFFDEGRFRIGYHDLVFPVSPRSSPLVLRAILREMRPHVDEDDYDLTELESVVTALQHVPPRDRTDAESVAERRRESFVSRRRLMALRENSEPFRAALEKALATYNGRPGDPRSFDDLEVVLQDQAYRLAYWRVAVEEINYRRFFDINDLAGVRVERGEVFQATHELILRLVAEGKVTALRIDHPDGLFDPYAYLRQLQQEATRHAGAGPVYIVVEKILTGSESLPDRWPVAGTVGYDFMNRCNGLFVARANEQEMSGVYGNFVGSRFDFHNIAYDRKKLILRVALASELNVLAYLLNRISEKNRRFRDFTLGSLTDALRETIACFPVYRTYIDAISGRVDPLDVAQVDRAIRTAIRRNRATSPTIFEFIRNILLLKWPDDLDENAREEHALFVMKFQQLTGPVMAKGVEDTTFYIYNRLVSLNEVGGEPDEFGIDPSEFHSWMLERSRKWPLAMNSSTTHDTKRSEDVRARINALSEIPAEWEARARKWSELNASKRLEVDGDPVPDANDEYLLYQTLIGTWPLSNAHHEEHLRFRERIQQYMEKATREAKVHTSWITPNVEYDDALRQFVGRILDFGGEGDGSEFLVDLVEFQRRIAHAGMLNSLAQTLVKLAAPGVPDIYQGQEIWDFSLVDPDNRRPVDYERRRAMLAELKGGLAEGERSALAGDVLRTWEDGRIKLLVTHTALEIRKRFRKLFQVGRYVALEVEGERAEHLFAFGRVDPGEAIVVAVPRLPLTFQAATGRSFVEASAWEETRAGLPADVSSHGYRNAFTGRPVPTTSSRDHHVFRAADLFEGFPVAILVPE
jgi:(1->4)-alpha-D-glucan 1-alpha-D-glucosylmutase